MKVFRLVMLGFGIAGQAFSRILLEKKQEILKDTGFDVRVVTITTGSHGTLHCADGIDLARATESLQRDGRFDPALGEISERTAMEVLREDEYDCMLELTPLNIQTGLPAADHIRLALSRGKHVVSANKGPLAWFYKELKETARKEDVCFFFETTVMAGTPLFNMVDACLNYCTIDRIEGILNATTNYILKQMEKGISYEEILKTGREQGFMEADVSMDIDGWDATAKLTVLANVLMDAGITPMDVDRTGIRNVRPEDIDRAHKAGKVIKLLCRAEKDEAGSIRCRVAPEEIPANDVFADEHLVAVVSLNTDLMGKLTILQYGLETTQTGYGVFVDTVRVLNTLRSRSSSL